MPDAQIPVMIMTPEIECINIDKKMIKKHPNWEPYAFAAMELEIDAKAEEKNEYAKFRKWLIDQEKKFVQKELEKQTKTEEVKKEETKKEPVAAVETPEPEQNQEAEG